MNALSFPAFLAMLAALPLAAQENRGAIVGRIADPSGAVIPSAAIRAVNAATGLDVSVRSNAEGAYFLPSLPPGRYLVTASAQGFKTAAAPDVPVQIQLQTRLDVVLEVGELAESISVTATAAALNTENTSLGALYDNKSILEIPVAGRNLTRLALLSPGVITSTNGISRATSAYTADSVPIAANGLRSSANQYTVDGANATNHAYGVPSFVPVLDAVEEFKALTGAYSAEFGGSGGLHVNYSLRSGTNTLHGSVWEFLRNDKLDARNTFSAGKPRLRQNQFGGLLAGPVRSNKLFYMGSYQGYRQRRDSVLQGNVPTEAQRRGDLSLRTDGRPETPVRDPATGQPFPGNQIPAARFSPAARRAMEFFPLPNQTGALNYRNQPNIPRDEDAALIKVDYYMRSNNRLAVRYAYQEAEMSGRIQPLIGDFLTRQPIRSQNAALLDTHTLSPSTLLDLRLSWNRMLLQELSPRSNSNFDARSALGIIVPSSNGPGQPDNGFPSISVAGFASLGDDSQVPVREPDDNLQLAGALSTLRGRHALRFALDARFARTARLHSRNTNGTINFAAGNPAGADNAFGDFLLGLPLSSSIGLSPLVADIRQRRFHFFAADTWNLHPKLTLDIGFRYELNRPAWETNGRIPLFDFTAPGAFRSLGKGGALFEEDWNNLAPRFGLAWRPSSRLVVRSSYGVFYSEPKRHGLHAKAANPPFAATLSFNSSRQAPLNLSDPWPLGLAAAGGVPSPQSFQSNARTPYVQTWTFNIQRALPGGWVVEAGYVGNHAVKMGRSIDLNTPLTPGPGAIQARRPLPNFGPASHISYDAFSNYHALQARTERRFAKGFSVLLSYAFSRSIELVGDEVTGQLTIDPLNLNRDRSLADMHATHRLTVSYVYELPFGAGRPFLSNARALDWAFGGWQLSGGTAFNSGQPFTPTAQGDRANLGLPTRPNRICDGNIPNPSPAAWFDTACFVLPAQYTIGNGGRNILIGPGFQQWDIGLMKRFRITETAFAQFRAEAFNAFNNVNYRIFNSVLGTPAFGRIPTAADARSLQLALKVQF